MESRDVAELTKAIMKRQLSLSLKVAAVFVVILIGLPLFNHFNPDAAKTPIAGFTLSWLVLGLLFYPLTWALSFWFVGASERLEDQIVDEQHNSETNTAESNISKTTIEETLN
jgi:uncharacterized membrane protein (DUF485 family)